jgi:DNA repair protein RadD
MITLRDYQQRAVDAVLDELAKVDSTLLVAPVGAGKTVIQAAFIQESAKIWPHVRFVCAVHTQELVQQNLQAMLRVWPGAPVGINSAALGQRNTHAKILFCSIQSVFRKARQIGFTDCLIVDECHLISRKGATMYQRFIAELRDINPEMRVVGMSGTPYRLDSGLLDEGPDALFKSTAFEIPLKQLIDEGYLTKPISKATATGFDLSDVHIRGGDYIPGELERAVNVAEVTESAVNEIIAFGQNRKAWIVFCAGVDHAKAVRDCFRSKHITCEMVDGTTPAGERASIIRRFKAGEIRALTNVNVLSTGFDYPGIDLVALMRPTKSAALYVQQCGRGLRLSPGKDNALILDFAGNIRALGPLDMINPRAPSKGNGKGELPAKVCENCKEIVHISCAICPSCDAEFPKSEKEEKPRHAPKADDGAGILSTEAVRPQLVPVVSWSFDRHEKIDSPPSLRVTYIAGLMQYRKWCAFEHSSYARQKACQWWSLHGGRMPFPVTVDEAIARRGELTMPAGINVRPEGKYFEITNYHFARQKEAAE